MAFETGNIVQPKKGGPAMSVVNIEDGLVYCGMMDSGEENSKAFRDALKPAYFGPIVWAARRLTALFSLAFKL